MRSPIRIILVFVVVFAFVAASPGATFEAQYKVPGGASYGYLGYSLARVPDLDGDGVDDIVAGAQGIGSAWVFSGSDGSVIHRLEGYGGDDFGSSVAAVDDLDGDSVPDIIVGAPYYDYAKVFSGADGKEIHTVWGVNGYEYFGYSVAGIGDADGDGYGDFVVGAPYGYDQNWNMTGYAVVYSGKNAGVLHTVYGIKYDEFGWSAAGGVDVDGDGCDDFAVGATTGVDPNSGTTPGYVTIYSGKSGSALITFTGKSDYSRFGASLALAGDVNGDGTPDLVVGATDERTQSGGSGVVRVISGADGSTLHTFSAEGNQNLLGFSVCGLGDVDGDGVDDIAAGTYDMEDPGGSWTGGVRAWSGASGDELFTLYGENYGDYFGYAVCALRDESSDLAWGLAVGAICESEGGSYAGSVYLYQDTSISGTVAIDCGAACTKDPEVMLTLSWLSRKSEILEVRVRNTDGDFGEWMEIAEEIDWTLSDGDGEKQVEVEFRDEFGVTVTAQSEIILLDTTAPDGTIELAGGAIYTNQNTVAVTVSFTDEGSGVDGVRLRNEGGAFGSWAAPDSVRQWTLTAGERAKTVEAEFRDRAGNVSRLASATIWVDRTAPSGTVSIAGGAPCALDREVVLTLSAHDEGGSGLTGMRIKRSDLTTWGPWVPYATTAEFTLPEGDGLKSVDAQFLDGAGNLSPVTTDTVILDVNAPVLTSLALNTDLNYVLPGMKIPFRITATDSPGSGVDAFRVTFDGGATFSAWIPYTPIPMDLPHPGLGDTHSLQVSLRDHAGNISALSAPRPLTFVDVNCPCPGANGSFSGTISSPADIDAVMVDLAKGDALAMKVKKSAAAKGAAFPLVFDVWLADGTQVAIGIPAIAGYAAPRTGRCYIVARLDGTDPGLGSYALSVAVKPCAANAKVKGTVTTGELRFEAVDGAMLKGSLKGAGLDPASVEVIGPNGPVAVTAAGKAGAAKLAGVLDQGTGTYVLRFTAAGPVTASLGTKLPAGAKLVEP